MVFHFLKNICLSDTNIWSILQNSTFRKMFSGRIITDIGDSLFYIAAMWLVWDLSRSPVYVGLAGALIQTAGALTFLYGPIIDTVKLRSILIGSQIFNGIAVLLIPVAATLNLLSVWLIIILTFIMQLVNELVYPAQNAALPRIVEQDELPRANSLFSTTLGTVDVVANAVGGVLISIIGALSLFILDAGTFAIALLIFMGIHIKNDTSENTNSSDHSQNDQSALVSKAEVKQYYLDLQEGIDYVRGSLLMPMMVGLMVSNVGIVAGTTIMPTFADSINGATAYGVLMAALAAGTLLGTATSFFFEKYPLGLVTAIGITLAGLLWVGAVAIPGLWPTALFLFFSTIPVGIFEVLYVSLIQGSIEEDFLGRVMSLLKTFSNGLRPAGALLGGIGASYISPAGVMYMSGGSLLCLGLYFFVHSGLRSLPPVSEATVATINPNSVSEY